MISKLGQIRRLTDGTVQMFICDPSNNLFELSSDPKDPVDPKIFKDELYQEDIYFSERNNFRGEKLINATSYH